MGTTVWVDKGVREELRKLQLAFGDPSVNATLRRLLDQPATDARALFAKHREEIRQVLRRRGLHGLVAFGSRARGDARPTSDLDLAAKLKPSADPLAVLAAESDLEAILGIPVNLVELPNEALADAIRREGVPFDA